MTKTGHQSPASTPTVEEILQIGKKTGPPPAKVAPSASAVSVDEILQTGTHAKGHKPEKKKATVLALTPVHLKDVYTEPVKLVDVSGRYRIISKVSRPVLRYDGGFIERFGRREPTASDYVSRAKWKAYLNGAESACGPTTSKLNPACHYEDLTDAVAAYRHYWEGKGTDRYGINYEKYLISDPSARELIERIASDFMQNAEIIGKNRSSFQIASTPYTIGPNGFGPYPATVNWRRTIGAHVLWVSAVVNVFVRSGQINYTADMTVHMEDKYNFNPGDKDLNDAIEDSENGVFEMIGWAHPYMNYASIARRVTWAEKQWLTRIMVAMPVPPPDKLVSAVWD